MAEAQEADQVEATQGAAGAAVPDPPGPAAPTAPPDAGAGFFQPGLEVAVLAAIVQSSEDAIIGKTLAGIIRSWNAGAEHMYGYAAAEVIGRSIAILFPPDRPDELPRILARLQRGERIEHFETVRVRKDGTRIDVSLAISPIKDAAGHIVGASTIARDITARKRAEENLRFLAEASALLGSSLDYETTLEHIARLAVPRIADWAFVEMLQDDGSIKRLAMAHADPAKDELMREYDRRYPLDPNAPEGSPKVIRTGRPELMLEIPDAFLQAVAQDAEHLSILRELGFRSAMVVPLRARGRTLGDLALVSAESGRRYTEDDLAMAQELAIRCALAVDNTRLYRQAQEGVRLRDHFLSVAAHELRTPITVLVGYAQVLERRMLPGQTVSAREQRAVHGMAEQAERLAQLTDVLLDVSRIDLGRFTIEREPVNLTPLVRRVVEAIQSGVDQHSVALQSTDTPLVVQGDELRLEQVLQNLLQNAMRYSPDGGTITVELERQADHAVLRVVDQGIGIPEAAQAHLFERFYRASNAMAVHVSGFGIGLYVVKEIVTLHGGTVELASEEGRGTTVTVRLPLDTHTSP